VVLTRRSARMRSHTGEVSFPGGRIDPGESPIACALREASEEVAIISGDVEVIGRLRSLSTWSSHAPIQPFVGLLPTRPVLRPNPAEVERAFTVPVVELFAGDVGSVELWPLPGGEERPIYFFALEGDTVWGATARILRDLLERLWAVISSGPDAVARGADGPRFSRRRGTGGEGDGPGRAWRGTQPCVTPERFARRQRP
jgi:8-oxo-dGTP pyrophosphatase MutT (NUDIX family)